MFRWSGRRSGVAPRPGPPDIAAESHVARMAGMTRLACGRVRRGPPKRLGRLISSPAGAADRPDSPHRPDAGVLGSLGSAQGDRPPCWSPRRKVQDKMRHVAPGRRRRPPPRRGRGRPHSSETTCGGQVHSAPLSRATAYRTGCRRRAPIPSQTAFPSAQRPGATTSASQAGRPAGARREEDDGRDAGVLDRAHQRLAGRHQRWRWAFPSSRCLPAARPARR